MNVFNYIMRKQSFSVSLRKTFARLACDSMMFFAIAKRKKKTKTEVLDGDFFDV